MLGPVALIVLSSLAAAILAFGVHPWLAQFDVGLTAIMLVRRLQWLLVAFSLLLCVALLGLVITNRRSVWWLVGLAPVLALFCYRFNPLDRHRLWVLEEPTFVDAADPAAPHLHDDWWVVGLVFEDQPYALPYHVLYRSPVVFITDYDKRMLLMWSAHANLSTAYTITRQLKPRDLEIVTAPADTLLLYNHRLGQFIVALTGRTPDGQLPAGFFKPVATQRTTWSSWRSQHPTTRVLVGYVGPDALPVPVLPRMAGRLIDGLAADSRVAVVFGPQPMALPAESLNKLPLNATAGQSHVLVVRYPRNGLRAFDRHIHEDLFLTFVSRTNRRLPEAVMIDTESNSWWTTDGLAVDGPLKGSRLRPLEMVQDVYWGVMKRWWPEIVLWRG